MNFNKFLTSKEYKITINIIHLITAAYLVYFGIIGALGKKISNYHYYILLTEAIIIILIHGYNLITRYRYNYYLYLAIIHIFLFAPIFIYIYIKKENVQSFFYDILIMLGGASFTINTYKIYRNLK